MTEHFDLKFNVFTIIIPAAVFQRAALSLAMVRVVSGPVLSGAVGQMSRYGAGDAGTAQGGKRSTRVGQREQGELRRLLLRFP